MIGTRTVLLLLAAVAAGPLRAQEAVTSSLEFYELEGPEKWPEPVRGLVQRALALTRQKLRYEFGSADPDKGGMDCSGTVYYTLTSSGWKGTPRSADGMYEWVKASGRLTEVTGTPDVDDAVLAAMRPGDLLFWSGTYRMADERRNPISHVMIYLGRTRGGKPVMFGSSDGRYYAGKRHSGVSVFDFKMPAAGGKPRFVGYGPVPGMDVTKLPTAPPGGKKPK